jgi:DNA-directed RNA polymerase specialized sigma24 family protein
MRTANPDDVTCRDPQPRWSLSRRALDRLLERLGEDPEVAAREYEFLRRRLITFFSLRRADTPEVLADETIDRVARRLDEGEVVEHLRGYFHGVAHRVALEWQKREKRERVAMEAHHPFLTMSPPIEEMEMRDACLERCLRSLPANTRALVVRYYHAQGLSNRDNRRDLAEHLGISYSNLKVRVHRIRGSLEDCLRQCIQSRKAGHDVE